MSLIFDSRFRARDDDGAPISGAKLTVYDAGTTDLAEIYTSSALSTPLDNPLEADADGWFAQIFAAEGATFDLILADASDVTIKTYDDVPSLGPEANTLERDFGLGGRFKVTGSGGTISIATGSASPDDTGGAVEFTGWAGTQLETARIHADVTTVSGALRTEGQTALNLEDPLTVEGGLELDGVVLEGPTSFSAVANVDIPLSADYDVVDIEFRDIRGAFSNFSARFSYDNASTYKSASSDYTNITVEGSGGGSASTGTFGGATTSIFCGLVGTSSAGLRGYARVRIITSSESSVATMLESDCTSQGNRSFGSGYGKNTYGRATHVRFITNTSTFSGSYRVIGRKGW